MLQFLKMDKEMIDVVQQFQGYQSEIKKLNHELEDARIEAQKSAIMQQKNEIIKAKVQNQLSTVANKLEKQEQGLSVVSNQITEMKGNQVAKEIKIKALES